MKKISICFAFALAVLVASPLVTVTLINVGQPLRGDGVFYVGPYTMRLGGRSIPVLCVDVQGDAYEGATWSASISKLSGDLRSTYHSTEIDHYEQAAYLFSLITKPEADREGIQHAVWAIMDPTYKADAVAAAWIAEAQRKYGSIDPSKFEVISDSNGPKDGRMQEFIALTPVPEPYLIHVLGGLVAIGLILLGRRRG